MPWSLPHQANKCLNPADPVNPRPRPAKPAIPAVSVTDDLNVAFSTPPKDSIRVLDGDGDPEREEVKELAAAG